MTFFKLLFQTIPDRNAGTPSKLSPHPTFNVDNQVNFSFDGKKSDIIQHWLGWMGDAWYSSRLSQLLLARIADKFIKIPTSGLKITKCNLRRNHIIDSYIYNAISMKIPCSNLFTQKVKMTTGKSYRLLGCHADCYLPLGSGAVKRLTTNHQQKSQIAAPCLSAVPKLYHWFSSLPSSFICQARLAYTSLETRRMHFSHAGC